MKPYELAESTSPWLGTVPSHWQVSRFGYEASINGGQVDPRDEPWASTVLVAPNHIESGTGRILGRETASEQGADSGKYLARAGQILYSKIRPALNKVTIAAEDCLCSADMYAMSFRPSVVPRYALYYMLARPFNSFATVTSMRVKMPKINRDELAAGPWLVPPLGEQRAIADYLDRETASIDTLISEQKRLIKMLLQRRQDLIRAAVIGTVNPFSPPAEVAFTAIGHHFSVTLGKMLDAGKAVRAEDRMLPYIRAGNIQDNGLKLYDAKEMPYSETEALNLNLLKGDLLVVEGGAVGTNVLLHEDMPGWSFQKTVNRLRPLSNWSSAWLGYVLKTYRDIGVIDIVCNRSTIPHLTAEKLRAVRIPSMDPQEQVRVAATLDRQTAEIDVLIEETERFIELSQERRSALITSAVTGQIDVREVW
ncbi:restriction endonuclease subunit S [Streptomyces sp. NPDC092903]|uniref:restriction endonuclease subunit S n=1 Tax=Streptomyces sp. NPDC092903 TaxID=3366017 RepID=UPI0037F323D8